MLSYARDHQPAFVLSNDMYRDHYDRYGKDWVRKVVIPFAFIGSACMPSEADLERAVFAGEAHPDAFGGGDTESAKAAASAESSAAEPSRVVVRPKPSTMNEVFGDVDWMNIDDSFGNGFEGEGYLGNPGRDDGNCEEDEDEEDDEDEDEEQHEVEHSVVRAK